MVLRWFFGEDAPILARVALEAPINEDRTLLCNLVGQLVSLGAPVPMAAIARRLNVPLARAGEQVFRPPAQALPSIHEPAPTALAGAFNHEETTTL